MKNILTLMILSLLLAGCLDEQPTTPPATSDVGIHSCLAEYTGLLPEGFTAENYALANQDLLAAVCVDGFCDSYDECKVLCDHYVNSGILEGRPIVPQQIVVPQSSAQVVVPQSSSTVDTPLSSSSTATTLQPNEALSAALADLAGWTSASTAQTPLGGMIEPQDDGSLRVRLYVQRSQWSAVLYKFSQPVDFSTLSKVSVVYSGWNGWLPDIYLMVDDGMQRGVTYFNRAMTGVRVLDSTQGSIVLSEDQGYDLESIRGIALVTPNTLTYSGFASFFLDSLVASRL